MAASVRESENSPRASASSSGGAIPPGAAATAGGQARAEAATTVLPPPMPTGAQQADLSTSNVPVARGHEDGAHGARAGQAQGNPWDAPEPGGSKRGLWVFLAVVLVVGGLAGYLYWRSHANGGEAKQGGPGGGRGGGNRQTPVVAVPATKGDLPIYLTGLGTVTPLKTVTVRSRVDGEIQDVAFDEGKPVKAGDLLVQIDPRPFEVQLAQAEGQLAKDQAALTNAQGELARYEKAADAIPKQQIETQKATVQQYAAAIKIDQGQIDNAKLQLTYSRITAPIDGRIGLRLVDRGNIVRASDATGVAVVTQLQPISVVFTLPQDEIPRLMKRVRAATTRPADATGAKPQAATGPTTRGSSDEGMPEVDAYDRDMKTVIAKGRLVAVDNQVDPQSGTIRLKAEFPNTDGLLFPNQFVNARLLVEVRRGVTIAPAAAVQQGPDSEYVFVVKTEKGEKDAKGASDGERDAKPEHAAAGDGKAGKADGGGGAKGGEQIEGVVEVRNVRTGPSEGDRVIIEEGLAPGEIVVTDGVDKLTKGSKVVVRQRMGGGGGRPTSGPTTRGAGGMREPSDLSRDGRPNGADSPSNSRGNRGDGNRERGARQGGNGSTNGGATEQSR